jgi:murein DD-endopeptidase
MLDSVAWQIWRACVGLKMILLVVVSCLVLIAIPSVRAQALPATPSLERFDAMYMPADLDQTSMTWPLPSEYPISSGFGQRRHPIDGSRSFHRGIDIAAPLGTPILSVATGQVVFAGWKKGYGWVIDVRHGPGWQSRYAHAQSIRVQKDERIVAGQVIGRVGRSGLATGPHLHLEIVWQGKRIDPSSIWRKL